MPDFPWLLSFSLFKWCSGFPKPFQKKKTLTPQRSSSEDASAFQRHPVYTIPGPNAIGNIAETRGNFRFAFCQYAKTCFSFKSPGFLREVPEKCGEKRENRHPFGYRDTLLGYTRFPIVRARPATRLLHTHSTRCQPGYNTTSARICQELSSKFQKYFSLRRFLPAEGKSVNGRTGSYTAGHRIHASGAVPRAFPAPQCGRPALPGSGPLPEW